MYLLEKGKAVCLRCYNHNNNNWAEVAIYTKQRLSDAVNEPKCAKKCYRTMDRVNDYLSKVDNYLNAMKFD